MKYKLMRSQAVECIGDVVYPQRLRKSAWVVLAESDSFAVLSNIINGLAPREDFKIMCADGRRVL